MYSNSTVNWRTDCTNFLVRHQTATWYGSIHSWRNAAPSVSVGGWLFVNFDDTLMEDIKTDSLIIYQQSTNTE